MHIWEFSGHLVKPRRRPLREGGPGKGGVQQRGSMKREVQGRVAKTISAQVLKPERS